MVGLFVFCVVVTMMFIFWCATYLEIAGKLRRRPFDQFDFSYMGPIGRISWRLAAQSVRVRIVYDESRDVHILELRTFPLGWKQTLGANRAGFVYNSFKSAELDANRLIDNMQQIIERTKKSQTVVKKFTVYGDVKKETK